MFRKTGIAQALLTRTCVSIALVCLLGFPLFSPASLAESRPEGFVYADEVVPDVVLELRYHSRDNFLGRPVDGYSSSRCILTREAASALKGVQMDLKRFGLGIKIFDAYRPQRAVDHFVRWAGNISDTQMKWKYYPNVDKKDLFKKGYIAMKSSHSRGSTVDLTIVAKGADGLVVELDMGSGFDFFGPVSWPSDMTVGPAQRAHRMLLQALMVQHGFVPYEKEWWHFTLSNEPFPERYFDFPIQ